MSGIVLNKIGSETVSNQHHIEANYQKHQAQGVEQSDSMSKNHDKAKEAKDISPKELKKVINKLNENVSMLNQDVKFAYNDSIKSLTVEVVDASTGKVIREIPPKEVINLQKKLSEVVGIIFDSKEVE